MGFNGYVPRPLIRPALAAIPLNLAARPLWAAIIGPSSRSSTVGIFARTCSFTRRGFRPWAIVKLLRATRSVFTEKTWSRSTPAGGPAKVRRPSRGGAEPIVVGGQPLKKAA